MADELKAYRLWIDFLKEALPDTWSKQVQIDFAGCDSHPTNTKEFEEWLFKANYNRGLFFDADKVLPTVIAVDHATMPLDEKQVTLVINMTASDDDIMSGVLAYINLYREEMGWKRAGRGRPEFKPEPAKYQMAMRPDTEALEIALEAYRLNKKHRNDPGWTNERLGKQLAKIYPIAVKVRLKDDGTDKSKELSDLASHYLDRAERIIEGVKVGVFPAK